jgi:hypothetical protein
MKGKMEAEYFYHYLWRFFNANPKISWEKNEIQDAIKEQYMELLNNQTVKVKSDEVDASKTR